MTPSLLVVGPYRRPDEESLPAHLARPPELRRARPSAGASTYPPVRRSVTYLPLRLERDGEGVAGWLQFGRRVAPSLDAAAGGVMWRLQIMEFWPFVVRVRWISHDPEA